MVGIVLLVLILIYLTLAVHELGHYLAFRKAGIPILGFYLGAPPWIWRWKKGGTEYRVGLLPLGGAVMVDEEKASRLSQREWVRAILAGPLFSLLAGLFGLFLFVLLGHLEVALKLMGAVLAFPFHLVAALFRLVFADLDAGFFVALKSSKQLVGRYGPQGIPLLFGIMNIGMFWANLLPIPPLDGGQALYRLLEGRPWARRLYPYALGLGVAFLVVAMGKIFLKDILRLLGR